ncbi:MAG: hypothetical protein M3N95_11545 [Actinomycetota bacterium]|nr:hypothetical protein [Actinomycetota bacterium]
MYVRALVPTKPTTKAPTTVERIVNTGQPSSPRGPQPLLVIGGALLIGAGIAFPTLYIRRRQARHTS